MKLRRSHIACIALITSVGIIGGCGGDASSEERDDMGSRTTRSAPGADVSTGVGSGHSASPSASPPTGNGGQEDQAGKGAPAPSPSSGSPTPRGMPTRGPGGGQEAVLVNLPGPTTQRCIAVGNRRDVRSGDMAAGPFDDARKAFKAGSPETQKVRLYFIPAHSRKMPGITVTLTHQRTGKVVRVRQKRWADADEFRFYDVETGLPRGGEWRVEAVAGRDRGCWSVIFS